MRLDEILGESIGREEALSILKANPQAHEIFLTFGRKHQEDILAFVQGKKGLPILYDSFFKYIFDPERHPERLEDFLSEVLGQKVKIEEVLAREGNKLAEEGTLVVMDIIVRLSDGSIVDVEMQKIGYLFTGERSSCYLSDMVMRQYNRIKATEQRRFQFNQMKPVYLVVLLEKSTREFWEVEPNFVHRLQNTFDSGVNINLLSNLVYISLDMFKEVSHNISNKMVAWLTFLSSDKPEDILSLVEQYPMFLECYQDIVKFRTKPEELINMFSEALIQIDKNTVQYMIEEQQKALEKTSKLLGDSEKALEKTSRQLEDSEKALEKTNKQLEDSEKALEDNKKELEKTSRQLEDSKKELEDKDRKIAELQRQLEKMNM